MEQLGLQGVSLNPDDVNGGTPDTFAAVTFIPLGDGVTYTAVIMVAGDTANAAYESTNADSARRVPMMS